MGGVVADAGAPDVDGEDAGVARADHEPIVRWNGSGGERAGEGGRGVEGEWNPKVEDGEDGWAVVEEEVLVESGLNEGANLVKEKAEVLVENVVKEEGSRKVSREEFARALVETVSKKTGYPEDVLGLDLDLEGDLGVDSIKRVEILAGMQGYMPEVGMNPEEMTEEQKMEALTILDKLASLKTLRQIIDWQVERSEPGLSGGGRSGAEAGA
ncbi:MAG: hypothetical protein HC904_17620 [Blastochloris sp.]|nr:hypothetical protein [Blastochloris sp.]